MAFWAPLRVERRNASPSLERDFCEVDAYMFPACWREWKGPDFGNEGRKTTRWGLDNLARWLRALNPEAALVMFGTNDLNGVDVGAYTATLEALIERCHDNGTVVLLNTIPPRSGYESKSADYAEVVRGLARDRNLPLVDYHAAILSLRPQDWDGSQPEFSQYADYDVPTLIARDGVHPSHPVAYRNDYSAEALSKNGFSLRNALVLAAYASLVREVFRR
jgi:hypothetical protein